MGKKEIRKERLLARREMPAREAAWRSSEIVARLRSLPVFAEAGSFLCYISSKDHEVDTHELAGWLLVGRKPVLVPIAEPNGRLVWSRIWSLRDLAPGRFGILEPRRAARRIVAPPHDSVCIVPGIAFTPDCHRIGYGGGYYDRFLATYRGAMIGLAYDLQIVSDFQSDAHDIPVDFVVTETTIYRSGLTV
ncbi:MAG: 5-formyltetrahydrofolate cyclo-ligase [Nitrospiraceae bacterium]|nr:5-formyltetrahydrofolate cyclo-ligase [Nitrospiraceae bacterium]